MDAGRRVVLRSAGASGVLAAALAAGLLRPERVLAASWNKDAFAAKTPADAMQKLGAANPAESKDIVIEAPQIAENGAVVPIEVTSKVPGTTSIAVLIEKNPFPLSSRFDFMAGAMPFVKINVKMGESSLVRVVAEAGGKFYTASREVKVTIGGCGG
ncbi:MAG: thiosulfate oxidation carrier protein SoxY [Proteobacteria bacterium]|nr:thiosulfate oxidation carrier protein SoxY [Pseudomonadota bacterium]